MNSWVKTLITLFAILSIAKASFAQGQVNFVNTSSTLISADGVPMPSASTKQFIFAVFLAPSTTVSGPGEIVTLYDPRFQLASAYNTNRSSSTSGLLVNRTQVDVTSAGGNPHSLGPGSTVDFVVRGWSANAGATWQEALASYNNGQTFIDMQIGSSVVGNDHVLGGGAIPVANLFGTFGWQVAGFNLYTIYAGGFQPIIFSQPLSQTVEAGPTVRLEVDAFTPGPVVGRPPLVYRWRFNATNLIGGATNPVLELKGVGPAQSGNYGVVVNNLFAAVTSAPAMVSVIAPVERRFAPGIVLSAPPASFLKVEYASTLGVSAQWTAFPAVHFTNRPQSFTDVTSPLPSQRFYRASTTTNAALSLGLRMVPALTLTGNPGDKVRVDGINAAQPMGDWFTLSTVTLTNTSQPYFDVTAPGQPARLYRFVRLP